MKRTPLFAEYSRYEKVRLTQFGEWELPLHFASGIITEHQAVRTAVGLFDISHMGLCSVEGPLATAFLDYIATNQISTLRDGQLLYTFFCYPHGGVVDDVIIFRHSAEHYQVVLNAANAEKDLLWLQEENPWAQEQRPLPLIRDLREEIGQVALQGPSAATLLASFVPEVEQVPFFRFITDVTLAGISCTISRNGYTGEDGFEIYAKRDQIVNIWRVLLEAGAVPCGLGCRDTLRLEAKLPLYGQELAEDISPLEANLGFFVKFEKEDFCGKAALEAQKETGIPRTLRGFEMLDNAVARHGYPVLLEGRQIGYVTSGTKSPTLNIFCGYALIERSHELKFGSEIEIEIHGRLRRACLVKTPFYKRT